MTRFDDPTPGECLVDDCSLREAIMHVNARDRGDDVINLPAGTYVIEITGDPEDDAANGDFDLKTGMIITGAGAETTIIDAGGSDGCCISRGSTPSPAPG